MKWFVRSLVLAGALLAAGGCDKIEQVYNCNDVCSRWQSCVDSEYDVAMCTETCDMEADMDADFAQRVSDCEACLDDRSCSESISCTADCFGVVP